MYYIKFYIKTVVINIYRFKTSVDVLQFPVSILPSKAIVQLLGLFLPLSRLSHPSNSSVVFPFFFCPGAPIALLFEVVHFLRSLCHISESNLLIDNKRLPNCLAFVKLHLTVCFQDY